MPGLLSLGHRPSECCGCGCCSGGISAAFTLDGDLVLVWHTSYPEPVDHWTVAEFVFKSGTGGESDVDLAPLVPIDPVDNTWTIPFPAWTAMATAVRFGVTAHFVGGGTQTDTFDFDIPANTPVPVTADWEVVSDFEVTLTNADRLADGLHTWPDGNIGMTDVDVMGTPTDLAFAANGGGGSGIVVPGAPPADLVQAVAGAEQALTPKTNAPGFIAAGSSAHASGSGAMAITKPSGWAIGDVAIVVAQVNTDGINVTPPDGTWEDLNGGVIAGGGGATHVRMWVFGHVMTAADLAASTWSFGRSGTAVGGLSAVVYRNADLANAALTPNSTASASTSPQALAVVTPSDNAVALFCAAVRVSSNITPPGSYTERADNTGAADTYIAERVIAAAGSTGTATATSGSAVWCTAHLALPAISQGDTDYRAGGPVGHLIAGNPVRVMVWHGETYEPDATQFWSFAGMASVTAAAITDLGRILAPNVEIDSPLRSAPLSEVMTIDFGGGSFARRPTGGGALDFEVLVWFKDALAEGPVGRKTKLGVARSTGAALVGAILSAQLPPFTKLYDGGWSEPGLGGLSDDLMAAADPDPVWFSVVWMADWDQYVMVHSNGLNRWCLVVRTSDDGIVWSEPYQLPTSRVTDLADSPYITAGNPVLVPGNEVDGDELVLYRTYSPQGRDHRWDDCVVERAVIRRLA